MAQIVKAKAAQARVLQAGKELVVNEVVRINHCPCFRREDKIVGDAGPPCHHCLEHPLVSQFQQSPPQFAGEVYAARFLALRRCELALDEVVLHEDVAVGVIVGDSELDVTPSDREQLAFAKAGTQRHQKQRVIVRAQFHGRGEECLGFTSGHGLRLVSWLHCLREPA